MPGHRVKNNGERRKRNRNGDHGIGDALKTFFAFIGDDNHVGFVSFENGHVLDDVGGDRFRRPCGAHQNQRLGGQVDMFFVFDDVR